MPISTIQIENFKSLKQVKLNLKRINILIGPNNSGKSSVLQALAILKQSRNSNQFVTNGQLMGLGEFQELVFRNNPDLEITIGIGGRISWNKPFLPFTNHLSNVDFFFGYSQSNRMLEHTFGGVAFGNTGLNWDKDYRSGTQQDQVSAVINGITINAFNLRQIGNITLSASVPQLQTDAEQTNLSLIKIAQLLTQVFEKIMIVPALRGQDTASVDQVQSLPQDFIDAGGHQMQEMKTIGALAMRRDLESKVSGWFERITGSTIRANLAPNKRVTATIERKGIITNVINEGFGSNKLVYLLIPLAAAPAGSLIGIEEPEVHLHPSAQIELANVLVEEALSGDKELIITSHSDFMLSYILTLIPSKKLSKNDLAIFSFDNKDGTTEVKELVIDDHGQVQGGLPSFFSANLDLMKKYSNAVFRHES